MHISNCILILKAKVIYNIFIEEQNFHRYAKQISQQIKNILFNKDTGINKYFTFPQT